MPVDHSLLGLEKRNGGGDQLFPSLKLPGNETDKTAEFVKLTEGILAGKSAKELDEMNAQLTGYVSFIPDPGLCVKMKDKNGKKVFLNLCISEKVPPLAKDVTEDELVEALKQDDISFRVPMSIGEPHNETDRVGESCVAYEVVIHPSLYAKLESSEIFYNFFLSLALEGLETKYSFSVDRETTVILKGKKFFGTLKEQRVRTKPRLITEIDEQETPTKMPAKPETTAPEPLYLLPEFKMWLDPVEKSPRNLSVEIHVPLAARLNLIDLFVGDNRLVLSSSMIRPKNYWLDAILPADVLSEDVDAVFSSITKVLTVTVPVKNTKA